MSSELPSETEVRGSMVAGLMVGKVFPDKEGMYRPSMKSWVYLMPGADILIFFLLGFKKEFILIIYIWGD